MNLDKDDLAARFRRLSDEELVCRAASGGLTALASSIALEEVRSRGLSLPAPAPEPGMDGAAAPADEAPYLGDLEIVARYLTPTEAHMLCACLQAAGVPAETGDTNLVQAHSLLTGAVGGACLRVPASFVPQARAVIAAFERGEFALDDGFDTGGPP